MIRLLGVAIDAGYTPERMAQTQTCQSCGRKLAAQQRADRRYCSDRCRQQARRDRERGRSRYDDQPFRTKAEALAVICAEIDGLIRELINTDVDPLVSEAADYALAPLERAVRRIPEAWRTLPAR